MNKAIVFAAGLLLSTAAAAQQYKWVDQNGKTQYGDTPPPGVKAQRLKAPTGPAPAPSAAAKSEKGAKTEKPASPEAAYRKRQEEAQKEAEKQAQADQEAANKRDNCARAQEGLRSLESGRVTRTDAKGERYYLDDDQIAKEQARARQIVQQNCN
jgi:hypothetical protein